MTLRERLFRRFFLSRINVVWGRKVSTDKMYVKVFFDCVECCHIEAYPNTDGGINIQEVKP